MSSIRSDSVLRLGKRLVDELGLNETNDTLSRWMAHYIAEKIKDVEAASSKDRNEKLAACADAILKLWAHRSELPNGKRPFEDFEPISRALASLDPDDTMPRYFRPIRSVATEDAEDTKTTQWFEIASGIDATARLLIWYCLAAAAETALDKVREWVELAKAAGVDEDLGVSIVLQFADDAGVLGSKNPEDLERERIEEFLKKLNAFDQFSKMLSVHLREKLDETREQEEAGE